MHHFSGERGASMSEANKVTKIGQIALVVSDIQKAMAFYRDILGLTYLFEAGPDLAFLMAGDTRIMLTHPEAEFKPGKSSTLYFKVNNVDSTQAEFFAKGAVKEGEPHLVAKMPDHELWMAFLRDPDGNLVGLMEERG
jgi:methylmalonyl-CoA/ethylmalonyl-CoA epimerase